MNRIFTTLIVICVFFQMAFATDDIQNNQNPGSPAKLLPISVFPYTEGFENGGMGTWFQVSYDDQDWTNHTLATPSNFTGPTGASEGTRYIYCETSPPAQNYDVFVVESPYFDFSNLSNPTFSFDYNMNFYSGAYGILKLEVSTDAGTSWDSLWGKQSSQGPNWLNAQVPLTLYGNQNNILLRFHFTLVGSNFSTYYNDVALDNFVIFEPVMNDIKAQAVVNPPPVSIEMTSAHVVGMEVKNIGSSLQSNYYTGYSIDGSPFYFDQIQDTILPDSVSKHSFSSHGDFSSPGFHQLKVLVDNAGDVNSSNDTLLTSIYNAPLPFYENFDSLGINNIPLGWYKIESNFCNVKISDHKYFTNPHSLMINKMNNYQGQEALIILPAFHGSYANLEVSFRSRLLSKWMTSNELSVGVLTDPQDHTTYVPLDTLDLQSQQWMLFTVDLSSYTGNGKYIAFKSNIYNYDRQIYIDDISLRRVFSNDVAITKILKPSSSIKMSNAIPVKVKIENPGLVPQSGIPLSFTTDKGVTVKTGIYYGTIHPGSSALYTFPDSANLSQTGTHTIKVYTHMPSDQQKVNDTLQKSVENFALPYTEDFDAPALTELPEGWTSLKDMTGKVILKHAHGNSPPNSIQIATTSHVNGNLMAIMPPCYSGLNNKWLKFHLLADKTTDILIVGVLSNPSDPATFTPVDTVSIINANQHTPHYVSFSNYTGNGKYIAFKHGTQQIYCRFNIDDVVLQAIPSGPVFSASPDPVDMGSISYNFTDTSFRKVTITNWGNSPLFISNSPVISGGNSSSFGLQDTNSYPKGISPTDSISLSVFFHGNNLGHKTSNLEIMDNSTTHIIPVFGIIEDPTIDTFPYIQDFEYQGDFPPGWKREHAQTTYYKWKTGKQTPSTGTGALYDHTSGSGNFIYTESSGSIPGESASFISPPTDLSSLNSPGMIYWYHMTGAQTGRLYVDVAVNGSWITGIDSITGPQQTSQSQPWLPKFTDLSAYANIDSIRLRAISNGSDKGDICIDDIAIADVKSGNILPDSIIGCNSDTILLYPGPFSSYQWSTGATSDSILLDSSALINGANIISLTVIDSLGFTMTDSAFVFFADKPTVSISGPDSIKYYKIANYTLDAGAGYSTYLWTTGDTSRFLLLDTAIYSLGSNLYTVMVTNQFGCDATDAHELWVINDVGSAENSSIPPINVFPNPNSGLFTIEITDAPGSRLEIMGMDGKLIISKEIGSRSYSEDYNLNGISKGVYFIRLSNNDYSIIKKFIVR